MPIYEYECRKCGARVEALQSLHDEDPVACAICQGPFKKLISGCAVHFKGTGFYQTDYKKTGNDRVGGLPAYRGQANPPDTSSIPDVNIEPHGK